MSTVRKSSNAMIAIGSIVIVSLLAIYALDKRPWKIKDPLDPRFNMTAFDPNDYNNHTEMSTVLGKLLTPNVSTIKEFDDIWCRHSPCGQIVDVRKITQHSRLDQCIAKIGAPSQGEAIYWFAATGKSPVFGGWNVWLKVSKDDVILDGCADDIVLFVPLPRETK